MDVKAAVLEVVVIVPPVVVAPMVVTHSAAVAVSATFGAKRLPRDVKRGPQIGQHCL